MWSLESPSIGDVAAQLERALSRDHGDPPYALTQAERDAVVARYANYDVGGGLACAALAAPTMSVGLSQAIHDAYAQVQVNARLGSLREDIKSGARLCPYCSAPAITDLDHYLPRSKYKDFAIYPRNLVPSCHPCNNIKRTFEANNDNEHLIQPYLDHLPTVIFLKAEIQIGPGGGLSVTFVVDQTATPDVALLARAEFQIEKFKLNDRLLTPVNVLLAELATSFEMAFDSGGGEAVASFLAKTASRQEQNFGLNDWRVALLRGLGGHQQFCDGHFKTVLGKIDFGQALA